MQRESVNGEDEDSENVAAFEK
ncbi:hypothetical protein A2U01_0059868, partial [Trifolium medium]|nr:hypothetical protein [Trifolium medium]